MTRPVSDMGEEAALTKREYFAAAALTGLLAADEEGNLTEEKAARLAVRQSDALISALNAKPGQP